MNEKNSGTFTLINDKTGDKYTLPVIDGVTGPSVIDVRRLYGETDHFTFDPGYTSTGSCESGLTYIDGDKGILLHRGYPIEQLAEQTKKLTNRAVQKEFAWMQTLPEGVSGCECWAGDPLMDDPLMLL